MKARKNVMRPRIGLLCSDAVAPFLIGQLAALGYEALRLPAAESVSVAIVDIDAGRADELIAALSGEGSRVVAFGPDPDDLRQMRARALGADSVVSTRALLADVGSHVPTIV